ncbi:MAG: hypothetical protein ACLQGP_37315 [Isosphaeraceae bacterium]
MSVGGEGGHLHPVPTRRTRLRYFFSDKHHGRGGPETAQWALDLSEDEEFVIFDRADDLDLSDDRGSLYGIRFGPERQVIALGTLRQQIAKFTDSGPHWHGFPLGPLDRNLHPPHPPERALPKDALQKMVDAQLLTREERKRLLKGKHI